VIKTTISNETFERGPFSLVIVDTSAAYFEGDDENQNVEAGEHARMLRSLIDTVEGGPTILVLCHPTKNPNLDNLLPRGGGAFVAEVDTNLICRKSEANTIELHWNGKIRGPDFAPLTFKLNPGTTDKLKDSKGRPIWTVTASLLSEEEEAEIEAASDERINKVLRFLKNKEGASLREIAEGLGWFYSDGVKPNKSLVQRILKKLKADKLIRDEGARTVLTPKGLMAAENAEAL
jgi:hypothetical protein